MHRRNQLVDGQQPSETQSIKTELIWLGSSRRLKHCPTDALNIAVVSIELSSYVRDLGVYVDGDLSLEAHISHLSRTCFYHLRQLSVMRRSLTMDSTHSLIRALVHSRVDYCNGVLAGLPQTQINMLQSILRAAARLVLQLPGWGSVSNLMCAAPLAFHPTEDSVQAVLGGVQVSFITRRRYTYEISACPSRLSRVVLTFDRLQPVTFASHRQRL